MTKEFSEVNIKETIFPCAVEHGNVRFDIIDINKIKFPVHIMYIDEYGKFVWPKETVHEWIWGISNIGTLRQIVVKYCGQNNDNSQGVFKIFEYDNEWQYLDAVKNNIVISNQLIHRSVLLTDAEIETILHSALQHYANFKNKCNV